MTRSASAAVFERVADLADRLQDALDRAVRAEAEVDRLSNRLAGAEERVVDLGALATDLERQSAMWKARAERVEQPNKIAMYRPARPVGSLLKSAGKPKGKRS